jgi:hypothetical protein
MKPLISVENIFSGLDEERQFKKMLECRHVVMGVRSTRCSAVPVRTGSHIFILLGTASRTEYCHGFGILRLFDACSTKFEAKENLRSAGKFIKFRERADLEMIRSDPSCIAKTAALK